MFKPQLVGMVETCGSDYFGKRTQSRLMKTEYALSLVVYDDRALTRRVLTGHPGWTAIGVTCLRLDATHREHKAARRVAPVGAQRHHPHDIESRRDLAGCPNSYMWSQTDADEC